MKKSFFLKNSPETIKNALSLTEEQFIEHYIHSTFSSKEILEKAYKEIRGKHQPVTPPVPENKEVTFKVIPTDKKVVPITTPVEEKAKKISKAINNAIDLADKLEKEARENPPTHFTGIRKKKPEEEAEKELSHEEEVEITGSGKSADDPVTVKRRGRQKLEKADQRDARIVELLKQGKKGSEVVRIMDEEGFRVFASQVTLIKQQHKL